ncbi:MAG: LPS biosynthesis protein [Alphaproteobacteria bacterium]|nr:MAG: LPS biosynthesis protein [Alphaproteobacteria bacterium]
MVGSVMRAGETDRNDGVDAAGGGELDFGSLGRSLWRKKWWVLAPSLAVALVAAVGVNLLTPKYKSEARILIEGRENVFLRPEADKNAERERNVDPEAVTSQVQLALSRDLARQVIRELKLGEKPEFDPALRGPSLVRTILGFVGLARDPLGMTPEERVLDAYYERIAVFPVDKSRVIAIEFQSQDPELAAQVANAIADTYLQLQQAVRQEQTRLAGRWLAGEIEGLRKRVAEAEAKVEDFRGKTNLFIGTNNTTLSNQTLGEANRDLATARAQKAELEAKARFIRELLKRGGPIEASDVLNSEVVRRLSEQRVTLQAQLAEQSSTLLGSHPRIKELKAQVGDLDRQLRVEAERVARAFENDAKIASARVESLSSSLDQLKRQASSNSGQDVELRALEREAKAQRDLLEAYLAKYREATARDSIGAAPSDARIISRAAASNTPYFPKKLPIVLIATLATMFTMAGFVATGELLHGPLATRGAAAVEPSFARPDPEPGEAVSEAAPANDESAGLTIADVAAGLREAGEGGRRVAVMGAARHVGTSVTAIALARLLAREGRVILVDLALSGPNLAAIAIDPSAPGIADLVRGAASFGEIMTRDRRSRAHLVPAGRVGADSAAILMSERLAIALDALARSYDHLVIDAGAVGDFDAVRMARFAPEAVLVAGPAAPELVKEACDQLSESGFTDIWLPGNAAASELPETTVAAA